MPSVYLDAVSHLPPNLSSPLARVSDAVQQSTYEIRLRANHPLSLRGSYGMLCLKQSGQTSVYHTDDDIFLSASEIAEIFRKICADSVHSYESELASGFLTLSGGHRVGIAGRAVLQNGEVSAVREITALNLRIARQIRGAAAPLYPLLSGWGGILLAGAPGSGKTTVLRDLITAASEGKSGRRYTVSVIDEREELGGSSHFDLGDSVDLFRGYPKAQGMEIALRAMSPDWLACDEIGSEAEAVQLLQSMHSGVRVMTTVHAHTKEDLNARPLIRKLLEAGVFSSVVFLGMPPGNCRDVLCLDREECANAPKTLRMR